MDEALEDDARRRIARRAGKHAGVVQHVTVRFAESRTDPAGGIACRIGASLEEHPSIVVEESAGDATIALRRAADELGRTLQRALRHVGRGVPSRPTRRPRDPAPGAVDARDDDGSLHGRRVGHAAADLERALARPEKRRRDALVDTSLPGVGASDRKAGQGATAARNTHRNTAGMTAALEDSRTRPSRKSTRRSTNRVKAATPKQRTTQLAVHDPKVAATRARAHRAATRG